MSIPSQPLSPKPIPYKAIFFDVGGTLIYPEPQRMLRIFSDLAPNSPVLDSWLRAIHETTVELDDAIKFEGALKDEWWNSYFSRLLNHLPENSHLAKDKVILFCNKLHEYHVSNNLWAYHATGADETLKTLMKQGFRLGIISNSDGRVRSQIEEAGWLQYFEFIIDSRVVGVEKPDPAIFQLGLEKANLSAREVLYIGDFVNIDKAGAASVGMDCIIIDPLFRRPELGQWRIDNLIDIIPWLENALTDRL
ncbi:MAG: HAD-IA family hydrolase [Candidatus Riflebacteria bacterium]|nr:HAD-IA family hydrolase [Candidatus Riflebacteria bacterium]